MSTLKKVIYFDESSAMDFLQIESKGKLTKTTELMTTLQGETGVEVDAEGRTGTIEGIKYENPKIGENFYVFKKFINKKL